MRFIYSPTELSWPEPQGGQTVRFIYSPTEPSWPGPWRRQMVRYTNSPAELLWPTVRITEGKNSLSHKRGERKRILANIKNIEGRSNWLFSNRFHIAENTDYLFCNSLSTVSSWSGVCVSNFLSYDEPLDKTNASTSCPQKFPTYQENRSCTGLLKESHTIHFLLLLWSFVLEDDQNLSWS